MRYLLDTHTVLWFLEDSEKLSEQVAMVIEDFVKTGKIRRRY
jgi:PIN domain nuclease of toxin-antitoxin system